VLTLFLTSSPPLVFLTGLSGRHRISPYCKPRFPGRPPWIDLARTSSEASNPARPSCLSLALRHFLGSLTLSPDPIRCILRTRVRIFDGSLSILFLALTLFLASASVSGSDCTGTKEKEKKLGSLESPASSSLYCASGSSSGTYSFS